MSHLSLYFTRGTPRSTTPAFTLDFSKEPNLEALAERLYKQYTSGHDEASYGDDWPSSGLPSEPPVSFVTHGHTTFEQTELGWISQSEGAEEQSLVTPTFAKPKPNDFAFTVPSSTPSTPAQSTPPSTTPTPARSTKPLEKIPAPVNSTAPPQGSSSFIRVPARETTTPGKTTGPPRRAPPLMYSRVAREALLISHEKSTRTPVPTSTRQGDLRRSVALLNANRSQSEKTVPTIQAAKEAAAKPTESKPQRPSDSQQPMSSSEYRPSSPSSQSSRSPTPKPPAHPISPSRRRSTRSRADPVTYNLKTLSRHQTGSHESPHQSEREDTPAVSESPPPSLASSTKQRKTSPGRPTLQDFPTDIQVEDEPRRKANLTKLLWTRELRGARSGHDLLRATVSSNLKLWKTWKGASNDVSTLAWSPDGTKFATGATAQSDEYNRSNNLLFGDLARNCLYELPDHHIRRDSSIATADDRLFPTVSTIEWVHRQLYTASFDNTVKIWNTDPLTSPDIPTCVRTLRHDSNVQVMSVSKFMPHLVATGTTRSFSLWNLLDDSLTPKALEIHRDPRQKANIVLEPTTLAWGQNETTKNYLVGGMGEYTGDQHKVPLLGHLGMWRVTESSLERRKLSPDSQNIFDVKWHPSMPRFAIGSAYSQSMNLPLRSRSVVQIYDIESGGKVVSIGKCACSAVDMNEVTFCPMDSTYVTASCTDGSTYVWDCRKDSKPIHKLSHGNSLNSLDPCHPRENTDLGVRVALWGTTIDQFYTGASDGYLKQWDIRRSTQDALVANTVQLNEGITSGAFSADKSQLLLGDYSGGIHVLSCEHTEDEIVNFDFKYAPEPPADEILGVPFANELVASGKLTIDPIFGPVQGPMYNGPYAAWARDLPKTVPLDELKRTPLSREYQLRQFDGPPVNDRLGLDAGSRRELQCQFNLARARHACRWRSGATSLSNGDNARKRKRDSRVDFGGIDKDGHASPARKKKKKKKDKLKKQRNTHVITRIGGSVIDLTMDSDSEQVTTSFASVTAAAGDSTRHSDCEILDQSMFRRLSHSPSPILKVLDEESDEDYWWPDSGRVDANLNADDL